MTPAERGWQSRSRDVPIAWSCSATDAAVTLLMFLYWMVYENVVFFYASQFGGLGLVLITSLVKLALPLILLGYTGLPSWSALTRGPVSHYLAFFGAFLAWALVPTIISGDPLSWLKLLPRVLFFLSAVAFFMKRPGAFVLFAKCLVVYSLFALAQYVVLYLTAGWNYSFRTPNGLMAGPFGLLGNVTGMLDLPGFAVPFVRLAGYWSEPSNASATAFAAFFLSRFLAKIGEGPGWRVASVGCLIAGIAAFSNAGYLALGSALLVGFVLETRRLTVRRVLQLAILLPLSFALLVIAVKGREYVVDNMSDNSWARAFTGVRSVDDAQLDPSAGRIDLLRNASTVTGSSFIGKGVQTVGSEGIADVSASAPVFWLVLVGVPGLLLLLGREVVLWVNAAVLAKAEPSTALLVQAMAAVVVQQASYGSWMNPNYFVLAAAILVFSSQLGRQHLAALRVTNGGAR